MSECILTDWSRDSKGYGFMVLNNKSVRHHRLVFAQANGIDFTDLPEVVRHTCDNPPCINPDHLLDGTILDNVQDRVDRDRSAKGMSHGSAKLTEDDVLWIRANSTNFFQKELAAMFGVTQATIFKIIHRIKWKHI